MNVNGEDLAGNSVTEQWTFTAIPDGTVSGKIVYKDGSPIANAVISSGGKSVTADEDGEFLIDVVEGEHIFEVSLNGKKIGSFRASTAPGESNQMDELIFYDTGRNLLDSLIWITYAAIFIVILLLLLNLIPRKRSLFK